MIFLKLQLELDFVDDYERPVLEKYEKISPTPTVREKKEKEQKVNFLISYNLLIDLKVLSQKLETIIKLYQSTP